MAFGSFGITDHTGHLLLHIGAALLSRTAMDALNLSVVGTMPSSDSNKASKDCNETHIYRERTGPRFY